MLLATVIPQYLDWAQHEKNHARTTIKQWGNSLRGFARFVGPEATTSDLNVLTFRRYLYDLRSRAKPARPRTVRSRFAALSSLCKWLIAQGVLQTNPVRQIQMPDLDAPEQHYVSDEEVINLLAACDRIADNRRAAMGLAVLSILVMAGLRRAELLDLYVADVDLSAQTVRVRNGKGRKKRLVSVCQECTDAVRNYLAFRPRDCRHRYLFAVDRNRRVYNNGLDTLLDQVKAAAGYKGAINIKPHALRHAYASRADHNGAPLTAIQGALGHSSPVVTSQYLHGDRDGARQVAEATAVRWGQAAVKQIQPNTNNKAPKHSAAWRRKLIER